MTDAMQHFLALLGLATCFDRAVPDRPTLRDHFRCQPEIIALCEAWCHYGMTVRTPPRSRAGIAPELSAPVLFVAIEGEQRSVAGSWVNDAEAGELQRWGCSCSRAASLRATSA